MVEKTQPLAESVILYVETHTHLITKRYRSEGIWLRKKFTR
ncbi:hypothetical protein HMPREF3213_01052 [Heyndrickxia coagulans]|uniref:Uncharacterized protein n=1 Tax=Heyndrickxia coagulans TaxID=1398 RepID=A0A0C5CAQ5_HEYCO|nr:hypothetical protein SB48_HM08orf02692 [Heyndrickxia coagulans]KWZ83993.1 hypothetical protein HMPREF3213_01052 [Heyndrickxia coagulans]